MQPMHAQSLLTHFLIKKSAKFTPVPSIIFGGDMAEVL